MNQLASPGLIDGHTHVGVDPLFYLQSHFPYAQDWPTLVEKGGVSGISQFDVFPMVSYVALGHAALRTGQIPPDIGEEIPYVFENRRLMVELVRRFPSHASAALPLWIIDPSRQPHAQVEALRELHQEFPCRGLKIQATVIKSFISDLLGSSACLMDLAEEKDWPVLIHTSVHPEDPWSRVEDILRLARARPGLRFCFAHSCRFDAAALDEVAALPNAWFDCSAHRIHCQLALVDSPAIAPRARRFVSDFRDPARVLRDLAEKYPSKLIWGSDAPFDSYIDDDYELRSSYREEADVLHQLDAAAQERIAGTNTRRFLGLKS